MHRLLPLLACALLMPVVAPAASADGGGVADAGDTAQDATPVALGEHEGSVDDADDAEDWYRVALPAAQGLRAVVRAGAGADLWVELVSPATSRVLQDGQVNHPEAPHEMRAGDASGEVLVRIAARGVRDGQMPYSLLLEAVPMADFVVTRFEVEDHPVATRAGDAPFAWAHTVTVEVANLGSAPGAGSVSVSAHASSTSPSSSWVGGRQLSLGIGERATLVVPWNSTGYAGDVRLVATSRAWAQGDLDHENSEAARTVVAYAPAGGHAVTVTPGWISCSGWPRDDHLCWYTESLADGLGAFVHARQGDAVVVVEARATTRGADADVCTTAVQEGSCPTRFRWIFGE